MKKYYQAIKVSFFILIILGMVGVLCFPTQEVAAQSVQDGDNPNASDQITAVFGQPEDNLAAALYDFEVSSIPGHFSKTEPKDEHTVLTLSPTLSWEQNDDATGYIYCVGTAILQCDQIPETDVELNTSVTIPINLSPGTTYHWQVWAYNASGERGANNAFWWSFTTGLAPQNFNKSMPGNGETGVPQYRWWLVWSGPANTDSFEYCMGTINGVCNYIDWTSTGISNHAQIVDMAPHTEYFWQVRAINAVGTTYANQGTWHSFTTSGMYPGAISKTAPADEASSQPLTLTFTWTSADRTDYYEFCLGLDVEAGSCDVIDWTSTGLEQTKTVSNLIPNHTYGWSVRAVNAEGHRLADEGHWWSFNTCSPGDPVNARFSAVPTSGHAPLTVAFINESTGDFDSCAWDFGDGAVSISCGHPNHTYLSVGVYTVTLTVSGGGGTNTHEESNFITVGDLVDNNLHKTFLPLVLH